MSSYILRGSNNFDNISYEVSDYLKNVYFQLATTIMFWSSGFLSYPHLQNFVPKSKILQLFIILVLMIPIIIYRYQERYWKKILLYCLGFSKGTFIGNFINVMEINCPGAIRLSMTITIIIFSTMSLLSGRIKNRIGFYFSSILFSCINSLVIVHLLHYLFDIFPINYLLNFDIYFGITLFSLYVCFDTQKIIYDVNNNLKDTEYHSLELFLDFINIFIRIFLMFVKGKKDNNKKEK